MDPADADKFYFDPLDCTKLWPTELIPPRPVGKMVLDKNVDNFFAEAEQIAFCPSVIVPGDVFREPSRSWCCYCCYCIWFCVSQ